MRFGLTFPSGSTAKWLDLVVVTIAAALAFALGYVYSAAHPVSREDGARAATQLLMMPAVNYACTGHFGPIRLAPEATSADTAAVREIRLFLLVRERDYSC